MVRSGERWSRSIWMDGVEEMPVGIASMHQTVLDGAQWRKMVKIYMDGWCGRDASWDCVNASDGARWCAWRKMVKI